MTPEELKLARRQLKLTQSQLAKVLGYNGGSLTVRRMEMDPRHNGHRPIPPAVALAVRYMLRDQREGRWRGVPDV